MLGKGEGIDDLPFALKEHAAVQDLQLESWPSLEAQVAALSDDIAYNNHDIDDSIRAGLITLDDLRQLPLTGDILADIDKTHGKIDEKLLRHELVREMISIMIADLVGVVRDGLNKDKVETADDARRWAARWRFFRRKWKPSIVKSKFSACARLSPSHGQWFNEQGAADYPRFV